MSFLVLVPEKGHGCAFKCTGAQCGDCPEEGIDPDTPRDPTKCSYCKKSDIEHDDRAFQAEEAERLSSLDDPNRLYNC
jgi:hypothetical protein